MQIDDATLRDLEVLLPSRTRGPCVFDFVDRTLTQAGRERLRLRLRTPAHDFDTILGWQQAHGVLAAGSEAYRALLDRADLDAVERYLTSNWRLPQVSRGVPGFMAGSWRGGWRRQYLTDVERGRNAVSSLLTAAAEASVHLGAADAVVLKDLGRAIAAQLDSHDGRELQRLAPGSRMFPLAFDSLARDRGKSTLERVVDAIGTLEAMWSLAVATREHGWTYPTPSSELQVRGLRHPFLGGDGVPNDLHLDDAVRVCFVTGPNMGGKSTFLKAVAVAMLLAHIGCGVPAAAMECPAVETIFSSVSLSDNLAAGESFYLAEVRRLRALATALAEHGSAIAILDEPLRGTNVHDAAEATLAVMTRLAAHPRALVFMASHLGELAPAIAGDARIRLLHFVADVTGDRPRFDYQLRDGVSEQRLGMTLLRQERVLELLERSAAAETTVRAGT